MTSQPMFPDRMLASPAFVRDMRTFLELPARTMLGISEIGGSEDGFAAESQSQALAERFGLGIDVAARMLRFANHIYDRASVLNLETDGAIAQIAANRRLSDELLELHRRESRRVDALIEHLIAQRERDS